MKSKIIRKTNIKGYRFLSRKNVFSVKRKICSIEKYKNIENMKKYGSEAKTFLLE